MVRKEKKGSIGSVTVHFKRTFKLNASKLRMENEFGSEDRGIEKNTF